MGIVFTEDMEQVIAELNRIAQKISDAISYPLTLNPDSSKELIVTIFRREILLWSNVLNNTMYQCIEKKIFQNNPSLAHANDSLKTKIASARRNTLKFLATTARQICRENQNKFNICEKYNSFDEIANSRPSFQ